MRCFLCFDLFNMMLSHHLMKLLEIQHSVAIYIEHLNHGDALVVGFLISQAIEHPLQAFGGYAPRPLLQFEHLKGPFKILLIPVFPLHQLHKILKVQQVVTVRVQIIDRCLSLFV